MEAPVLLHLGVVLRAAWSTERDELEAVRAGLDGAEGGGRDTQRIERLQVDDLVVDLGAAAAG